MKIPSDTYIFTFISLDWVLLSFAAVSQSYIPWQVPGEQVFCVRESVPRHTF